jgi:hypothetical protein
MVVAGLAAIVTAPPAHACSCVGFTDEQAFTRADVVFVGRVVGYSAPAIPRSSIDPALWTFRVDRVYKGAAAARQGVVSALSGASCGLEIPRRGTFVVFARREPDLPERRVEGTTLYAGLCDGTRPVAERPVPVAFGAARPPIAGERGIVDVGITRNDLRWVVVAVGLVVVLAAVVVTTIVRRRRRRRAGPVGATLSG